ncbi:MAG: hypothetical protein AAB225_15950 [Acidobacteriota bacterium]
MRVRRPSLVHPPGIAQRLLEWLRGRDQMLLRPAGELPLLLLSFPRGGQAAAREIEAAYTRTLPGLRPETRAPYEPVFRSLPVMVAVLLRPVNPCGCLGHHHPRGAESRFARRLSADLGHPIAEIDLAYEGIRDWQPEPLSSLAAGDLGGRMRELHFQAAVLAVLLHEMEHLTFPDRSETEIRARSNEFYAMTMRELVAAESGAYYGMASPPPRP